MGRVDGLLALFKLVWPLVREQVEAFAKDVAKEVAKEAGKQTLQHACDKLLHGLRQLLDPETAPPNRSVLRRTARVATPPLAAPPLAFDPLARAVLGYKGVLKKAADLSNVIAGKAPMKLLAMEPPPTTTAARNILKSQAILRASHRASGIDTGALSIFASKTPATASSAEPSVLVDKALGGDQDTIDALVDKALGVEVPAQDTIDALVDKALGVEVPAQDTIDALVDKALGVEVPAQDTIDALVDKALAVDKVTASATIGALVEAVQHQDTIGALVEAVQHQDTIGALEAVLGDKVPAPGVQHQAPAPALEGKDAGDSKAGLYFVLACSGVLLVVVAYKVWRKYWGGQPGAAAAPQAEVVVDPEAGATVVGEASTSQEPQEAAVDVPAPSKDEEPQEAAGDGNGVVHDNNNNNTTDK